MSDHLPVWVGVSFAVHAAALAGFLLLARPGAEPARQVAVQGVELLIRAPERRAPGAPAAKPKPLSTLDFLKLALPSVPRAARLAAADASLPKPRLAAPAQTPRLRERLPRERLKLAAPSLAPERAPQAALEAQAETARRAAATLAALPRLEDVGRRRVRNLPRALVLEEKRREAVSLEGLSVPSPQAPSHRAAMAAAAALEDAAPPAAVPPPRRGLSALLPETPLEGVGRPMAAPALPSADAAPAAPRREGLAKAAAKKGVEIEGPLAHRRVLHYVVPSFPSWAKAQGIAEAAVSIRFNVDPAGLVLPDMSVERTSGFGRLDRLAMAALRSWRFEPLAGEGAQWGVITFRFLLE